MAQASPAMSRRTRFYGFMQNLGKAFMFPIATLAAMGILVGIGSSFTAPSMMERLPFLQNSIVHGVFSFINTVGSFGFTYLPAMFAMAIPFGLAARNKGVGAIAAFAGYISFNLGINFMLGQLGNLANPAKLQGTGQSMVLGIQTLETGVVGGIVVGLIVYFLLERFQEIKLPDAFSFFGGIRFIPIISVIVMSLIGLLFPFVWPTVQNGIIELGRLIQYAGPFGPFLYGIALSVLKLMGLHHILLAMIRFTDAGGTAVVAGKAYHGALNIFYAQLNHGVPISGKATAFLSQGFMPTFMFALPAICLAIYLTAKPENRDRIKGLLISASLVAIVSGISEPTEYLFLFIAPMLYVFHTVMQGLSLSVMMLLGAHMGNTDGGVLDWILFGWLQPGSRWWVLIPVGIAWFAIYFFAFRWYILRKNVKTPGREDAGAAVMTKGAGIYDPKVILGALGGATNITSLDNCVTRLRLMVKDPNKLDEDKLKQSGALAVMKADKAIQIVYGAQVQSVKDGLEKEMGGLAPQA
ncbi:MAG: PTS transporter subunit EIIC [Schleiferilactobacillus harbinensis]|jgi:PTS system maltose and glucose-specific IIC component|nr:PTS transporter subunit EIIC [Schleiferilactobacillus harbinensis]MCI1911469.1 PTS transporter subunit EIIC [Schleiferilactobacillus harbinensis]